MSLLRQMPGVSTYQGRTQLLPRDPTPDGAPLSLDRNEHNERIDLELIVDQLENLGSGLLRSMLHHCASRVDPAELGTWLREISQAIAEHQEHPERARAHAHPASASPAAVGQLHVELAMALPHGLLPEDHLFEGNNTSPPVRWSGAPAETVSFALVLQDLDRDAEEPRYYWVQHSIPGHARELPRDAGTIGAPRVDVGLPAPVDAEPTRLAVYHGPKPSHEPHRYELTLYALSYDIEAAAITNATEFVARITDPARPPLATATTTFLAKSPFSNRDFLFVGNPQLGRVFGWRPWSVGALFAVLSLALLVFPSWLLSLHSLPPEGWNARLGACATDNRGFVWQWNWALTYTAFIPFIFALAARFMVLLRHSIQRIARRPGGVILAPRAAPFSSFVQSELAVYARRTTLAAAAIALLVNLIDTAPLLRSLWTHDTSHIRPYWAIAFEHAKGIDATRNVVFDILAYASQTGFTFLFAFITLKFLAFLVVFSRALRGRYSGKGYLFVPYWKDPDRRLGLRGLARAYNTFIALALLVTLFAVIHRLQLISELECGLGQYTSDVIALFGGDIGKADDAMRLRAVTTGMGAMAFALLLPFAVIIYLPLIQIQRYVRQQVEDEFDVHQIRSQLARTEEQKQALAEHLQLLREVNVWPQGDAAAFVSLAAWAVLFAGALYPPMLILGFAAGGFTGAFKLVQRRFFRRATTEIR